MAANLAPQAVTDQTVCAVDQATDDAPAELGKVVAR